MESNISVRQNDDTFPGVEASLIEPNLLAFLESSKFVEASTNASRLVSRLRSDIQNNQLYQIHQDLRNIYFRFVNVKEKIDALVDLLYHSSAHLLKNGELITGQDIAMLLLEVSAKHLQNHLDDDSRQDVEAGLLLSNIDYHKQNQTKPYRVCRQVACLAVRLPDTELGRQKFIAETLKILTPKILNRDLLHQELAGVFWSQKDYCNARYHFLKGATVENSDIVGSFLVEYHCSKSTKSEVDLFIAQFIFQLLCLQSPTDPPRAPTSTSVKQEGASNPNAGVTRKTRRVIKSIAEKIFSRYALKHPLLNQVEVPFISLPLLNFTYFIISILDCNPPESAVFKTLCDIYGVTLNRDPNYQNYLNRIGIIYFALVDRQKQQQQQQQQQGGFFQDILMSLFDGNDEDDNHSGDESNLNNNMSLCDELD